MKKRIFALALAVAMLLGLAACGGKEYDNLILSLDESSQNEQGGSNAESLENAAPAAAQIDPFEGLTVTFEGISPFCTVIINNANCSDLAQEMVEYSVSPDTVTTEGQFALGESVTIYASLRSSSGYTSETQPTYALTQTEKAWKVENVPEYLTSIPEELDLSDFLQEEQDYLTSITAWTQNDRPFEVGENGLFKFKSFSDLNLESAYFSSMKKSAYSKYQNDLEYFNCIVLNYSIRITAARKNKESTEVRHIAVLAKNIVRYPDGSLGWGIDDPAALDFEYDWNATGQKDLIAKHITAARADYNVTEITARIKS